MTLRELHSYAVAVLGYLRSYVLTLFAVYRRPQELMATEKIKLRKSSLLSPRSFLIASIIINSAIESIVWHSNFLVLFELPQTFSWLQVVPTLLPVYIPLIALLNFVLLTVLPWIVIRLFFQKFSLSGLFHVYCYLTAGIAMPFAMFGFLAISIIESLNLSRDILGPIGYQISILFGLGILYILYWFVRRLTEKFDVSFVVASTFVLASLIIGSLLDILIGPLQTFRIPSASMSPALQPNDRIAANRWSYKSREPRRGEIVIYYPDAMSQHGPPFISRVIGLPGDVVEVSNGVLFVNGAEVVSSSEYESTNGRVSREMHGEVVFKVIHRYPKHLQKSFRIDVPFDRYFLMSDARDNALDSRFTGPVQLDQIVGHAYYRFWPISREGEI